MNIIEILMKFNLQNVDDKQIKNIKSKMDLYDVGQSGKGKRYLNFEHLVQSRGLNGSIELSGVKLTRWQLEGLKDYIISNGTYNLLYINIDEYNMEIVESYKDSDLSL